MQEKISDTKIQKIRINYPYPGDSILGQLQLLVGLPLYKNEQFDLLYSYIYMLSQVPSDEYECFSEFTTRLLWFMKYPNDLYNKYNEDRYDKWLNYLCDMELEHRKESGILEQHPENDLVIKEEQELRFLELFDVVHTIIYSENELTINPRNIAFEYKDEKTGKTIIIRPADNEMTIRG